ncbi:MAG: nucleoside triphosphate pyrophosphatase [Gammaproteobacteria bacterium]|nr:MAG: nucleoside triphosphate pyrophosphatase [Gammaproteobacteria bacterium]
MAKSVQPSIILASTSVFRRSLMDRLGLGYETYAPVIDESRLDGEDAGTMVKRLAELKARAARDVFPGALIIGSDQAAVINSEILGKPGSHDRAVRQLKAASGQRVSFVTGLCLLNSQSGATQCEVVPFHVYFKALTSGEIEHYLKIEQPYNCAGSFKSEGLGVALFERMEGDDPTALIGLPLIALCRMLNTEGVSVL